MVPYIIFRISGAKLLKKNQLGSLNVQKQRIAKISYIYCRKYDWVTDYLLIMHRVLKLNVKLAASEVLQILL